MGRKVTANTFTDGLIKDLNPINTPKSVLTDCLNGTIITYNGNEYHLQNDMGNIALKNCKLPENYIPVGLREYADILYIVSYNPITKKVQIGTYPSPEQANSSIDTPTDAVIKDIIENIDWEPFNEDYEMKFYSDVVLDESDSSEEGFEQLYIFGDNKLKLYPGDQYKMEITSSDQSEFVKKGKFEEWKFYILDDDSNLTDVTDLIEINTNDKVYVQWNVPGWLAVKKRVADIKEFNINVKNFNKNQFYDEVSIDLNFELITNDVLISKPQDLGILIYQNDGDFDLAKLIELIQLDKKIDYYDNGNVIFYRNWAKKFYPESDEGDDVITTLVMSFIPVLFIDDHHFVIFDSLVKSITLNFDKVADINDVSIAQNKWQYLLDINDGKLEINFDSSNGNDNLIPYKDELKCYYTIKSVLVENNIVGTFTTVDNNNNYYERRLFEDYNVDGNNKLILDTKEFSENNWTTNIYGHRYLYPENIYIIDLWLEAGNGVHSNIGNKIRKLVIASELFNGRNEQDYSKISFDDWFSGYENLIKNNAQIVINPTYTSSEVKDIETSNAFNTWNAGNTFTNQFSTFIPLENENKLNGTTSVSISEEQKHSITSKFNNILLCGPMWMGFGPKTIDVKLYKDDLEIASDTKNIKNNYSKDFSDWTTEINLDYVVGSNCQFEMISNQINVWDFKSRNLRYINDMWNTILVDDLPIVINYPRFSTIFTSIMDTTTCVINLVDDWKVLTNTFNETSSNFEQNIDNSVWFKEIVQKLGPDKTYDFMPIEVIVSTVSGNQNDTLDFFQKNSADSYNMRIHPRFSQTFIKYKGFVIINVANKPCWIAVWNQNPDIENFSEWREHLLSFANAIKYVDCYEETELSGKFYKANIIENSPKLIKNSFKLTSGFNFIETIWNFGNYDFSKSDSASNFNTWLMEQGCDTLNFILNSDLSLDITVDKSINKQVNLVNTQTIENKYTSFKNTIIEKNTLIESQYSLYTDNQEIFKLCKSRYFCEDASSAATSFLKYLNNDESVVLNPIQLYGNNVYAGNNRFTLLWNLGLTNKDDQIGELDD